MFRRVFVQTQIKPAAGFWGLERWKEKASWGLFHLAGAKPRHTGQSILGVWQRTHVGWQMTKMCGLVTVRPPPTRKPPPLPDAYTDGEPGRSLGMLKMICSLTESTAWSCRSSVQKDCNMKDSACGFSACAALLAPSEGLTVWTCSNVTYSHAKRPKSVVKEQQ